MVDSGPDLNRNGVLDDREVERSTPVCNAAAPMTLIRIEAEPSGAHCYSGGERILTGPDRNRDGVLGDDEIAATTYACAVSEVFHGDFTEAMWADPAAVAALHEARVITGSLIVNSVEPVSLPRLEIVGGSATVVQAGTPTAFDVPALAQVGADVSFRDAGFTGDVAMPALARVGGSLEIVDVPGDASDAYRVSAPALVEVGDALVLEARIAAVDLPALRSVGGDLRADGLSLTELELPALTSVGATLVISRNYQLAALDLHALRWVGGGLDLLDILHVPTIDLPVLGETGGLSLDIVNASRVSFPMLAAVHGPVEFLAVTQLQELSLPALRTVDDSMSISQSSRLVHVVLPALETVGEHPALLTTSWSFLVTGKALQGVELPRLRSAPQGVIVEFARTLTALTLPALTETKSLTVTGVASLATVALPALTSVGAMVIDAPALTELALDKLATVSDSLLLRNTQLVDLRGLGSATTIASLAVDHNPALTSLAGLEQLTRIAGQLAVTRNAKLASLAALANLTAVGGAVTVTDDPALSPDEVAALLQRLQH